MYVQYVCVWTVFVCMDTASFYINIVVIPVDKLLDSVGVSKQCPCVWTVSVCMDNIRV